MAGLVFFVLFCFLLFTYLAAPGLRSGMQDLLVAVACKLSVAACGIQFPDRGWNLGSQHREHGAFATGPPGNSRIVSVSLLDFFGSLLKSHTHARGAIRDSLTPGSRP